MLPNKTVLVTGGGGYLGSVMVPRLLEIGYEVRVLDRFFWGKEVFRDLLPNNNLVLIEADTRSYPAEYLRGVDVVIDLAALSNDPIAELSPEITLDINYHARVRTAMLAKSMGVKQYILASSCSVYGFREELLDESAETAPVTTYARASVLAEDGVLPLADEGFCVTVLRQGTLYGLSPRMRFDLVVNTMVLSLFKNKLITVLGGEQWRPMLHVKDSAETFIATMEADAKLVSGQIMNIGSPEQNFRIEDLAKVIAAAIDPAAQIVVQEAQADFRSYHVAFNKMRDRIKYQPQHTVSEAAKEIYVALTNKLVTDSIETKTIEWYKHLLAEDHSLLDNKKFASEEVAAL